MEKEAILNQIFNNIRDIQSESVFIRDTKSGKDYSFGTFFSMVQQIGNKLEGKYDEIIVCKENSFELCLLLFVCLIKNITVIPVDPRKENKELQEVKKNHLGAGWISDADKFDFKSIEQQTVSIIDLFVKVDFKKNFLITYTSGTTGISKGVIHSAGNLFINAYIFGKSLGLQECCLAHIMPMTYMAGILNSLILPFVMKGKIVIFPRFEIKTMGIFWKNIDKYSINMIWMSPTMLNMISCYDKKGSKANYIRDNNVVFCVGTAPLSQNVKEKFERLFQTRVYQSYGLTELLLLTTENLETGRNINSVGKPIEGVQMKLEDNELLVKVPWGFKGYTNEDSEICFSGLYFRSGDLAAFQEGNLFISGRKKEMIIRGGIKINPREIEKVIYSVPGVEECRVDAVIVDDEEKICCYLVSIGSFTKCVEKIKQEIACVLGSLYSIDYFIQMRELPKNLNGKIDSARLRQYSDNVIKNGEQYDY